MMSSYKDYRLSPDTTPAAEELLFELLAKKTPAEKLRMLCQASAAMRTLAMTGLCERYPNETSQQRRVKLAALLYGEDVASKIAKRLTGCHA